MSRDSHRKASEAVIAARRTQNDAYTAQDEAESGHLVAVAAALDADPTNVALLRELRISLKSFRANTEAARTGPDLATFLSDKIREDSP